MLSIAPPPTIYLHAGATDMRKSFDGLSGIIRGSFGGDPAGKPHVVVGVAVGHGRHRSHLGPQGAQQINFFLGLSIGNDD